MIFWIKLIDSFFVVTHPQTGHKLNIGLDVVAVPRLRPSLELAEISGCDFVLAPLAHPRYERVGVQTLAPDSP